MFNDLQITKWTGSIHIKDMLKPYEPTRALRSTRSNLLCIPKTKYKTFGERAFVHAAPFLWNSVLTDEIRNATSVTIFKSKLKTRHFSMYFQ